MKKLSIMQEIKLTKLISLQDSVVSIYYKIRINICYLQADIFSIKIRETVLSKYWHRANDDETYKTQILSRIIKTLNLQCLAKCVRLQDDYYLFQERKSEGNKQQHFERWETTKKRAKKTYCLSVF